jgi:hypothetical protein
VAQSSNTTSVRSRVANLPGVGQGMLDTLQVLMGQPINYREIPGNVSVLGELQRAGTAQSDTANVLINLLRTQQMAGKNKKFGYGKQTPAGVLSHEVIGHGVFGKSFDPASEQQADMLGRAFLRLSGRGAGLSDPSMEEFLVTVRLSKLLEEKLNGR